ncbi:AAA family ATPase [Halorubrum pallidum]|uniref:AAA family ATPase n=1 Tax=Halorubrum pallidum TaxID=1526114 RepID=A0ABD5T3J5_9EURY
MTNIVYDGTPESIEQERELITELGGDPETDHPFEAETDQMRDIPQELYVVHDPDILGWIKQNVSKKPLLLVSPVGTGKTTLSNICEREFPEDRYFITSLRGDNNRTTKRQLCEHILTQAIEEGYEIDEDRYGPIRDGIPHATTEAEEALHRFISELEDDGRRLLFFADQIENYNPDLFDVLQTLADKGAGVLITGTPEGRDHLKEADGTQSEDLALYDRLEEYPRPFHPFSEEHISEFFAKAFAYASGGNLSVAEGQRLLSDGAVERIHELTDGHPRNVRQIGQDVFLAVAQKYADGEPIEEIKLTAADVDDATVQTAG